MNVGRRALHLAVAGAGFVALSPVMVAVSVLIRLDSPGPVVFRQARVGRNGHEFDMVKFRTMRDHTESVAVFSTIGDERVTRVGEWLRRLRLDELPQLWNVLRGDMNLVGPRPERPEFVAEFCETVEGYDRRHSVLPGITGLAQVKLGYAASAADKLILDLDYISRQSLRLDFEILMQTVFGLTELSAEGVHPDDPRATGPLVTAEHGLKTEEAAGTNS